MSSLFSRVKSVEQSIADTDEPDSKLRKDLTAWDLTVFGVAVVVGAGIFTLTARTAGNVAGPSVSLAFVIAAVACGLAALCYAEFASTVPVAGSAYTFTFATFGEFLAWIIGWDLMLKLALAASVVSKGWSAYLGDFLDITTTVDIGFDFDWGAVLLIAVLTVLLALGTKISSRVSLVITSIKVGGGAADDHRRRVLHQDVQLQPVHPRLGAAGHRIGHPPDAVLSPHRRRRHRLRLVRAARSSIAGVLRLHRLRCRGDDRGGDQGPAAGAAAGILGSLAIVTVLYVLVTLVLTGMVPYTDLAGDSTPDHRIRDPWRHLGGLDHQPRRHRGPDHRGHGDAAGPDAGGVRDVARRFAAAFAGTHRKARHTRPADRHRRRHLGRAGGDLPDGHLEEMVNIGTLFAFVLVSIGVVVLRRTRPELSRGSKVR